MINTILFDLDDTLLDSNMGQFMNRYFQRIMDYSEPLLSRESFLQELLLGTRVMMADTDSTVTNRDAFWRSFHERTGLDVDQAEAHLARFYEDEFPHLRTVTAPRPVARDLVRWAFDAGYQVVIATNPVFPRRAIEHRLAWAGVPVDEFPFTLVTAYENMTATKPHPAYYRQILAETACQPEEAIMIGDNWRHDILPAAEMGLFTYWIAPAEAERPSPAPAGVPTGRGPLEKLYDLVRDGWLAQPDMTA